MFLNQLNLEQRKTFIELAHYTANVDGVFADEEKYLIEIYKNEAGISYYDPKGNNISQIVPVFDTKSSQRIILLEITALIYSDDKVTVEESKLLKELQMSFKFSEDELKRAKDWVEKYANLQNEGFNFIDG
ncbi:hypothetical protein QUF90_06390 [Desulfococcaceae bacterium HSG9]|nr:hypothetical protein [Desulfococcaceae bacterium HSG9]